MLQPSQRVAQKTQEVLGVFCLSQYQNLAKTTSWTNDCKGSCIHHLLVLQTCDTMEQK